MKLLLYNTLLRKKEEFNPIKKGKVGLYTCGPTVYNYAHLGNLRTYLFEDLLKRALLFNGFKVAHVMNITDVGHLTGDRDMGEDKMEKGAAREGKSAWEIAEFYTEAFKKDIAALNIIEPDVWCKATDYIKEQIAMIRTLEKKGFIYLTSDGVYFDTKKFPGYNKLSHKNLASLKEGARVEKNKEKKNATDFALWKFSPATPPGHSRRQMEWKSPWGIGFPGWHIECSAMSVKFLGKQFDIHCGGIDHVDIHHTNEIAQTEAATGKIPWVRVWMHGAFLIVSGGKKMAKSEDNFLTLESSLVKKGINPLAYRYAALQTHYRKPMEYSQEAMQHAQNALEHLYNQVRELGKPEKAKADPEMLAKFSGAINDDLNLPKALAQVQVLLKSQLESKVKFATIMEYDKVFGLKLKEATDEENAIPEKIEALIKERGEARKNKEWKKSDQIREEINSLGYILEDTAAGMRVKKK